MGAVPPRGLCGAERHRHRSPARGADALASAGVGFGCSASRWPRVSGRSASISVRCVRARRKVFMGTRPKRHFRSTPSIRLGALFTNPAIVGYLGHQEPQVMKISLRMAFAIAPFASARTGPYFNPLIQSSAVASPKHLNELNSPWQAPAGMARKNLMSLKEMEVDAARSVRGVAAGSHAPMFDMLTGDPSGRYLFIPHTTPFGAGVSRYDTASERTEPLFPGDARPKPAGRMAAQSGNTPSPPSLRRAGRPTAPSSWAKHGPASVAWWKFCSRSARRHPIYWRARSPSATTTGCGEAWPTWPMRASASA